MAIKIYELCGADPQHVFSPHCWKIRMAVAHKGLQWETVPTPFTKVATVEGGDARRIPVIRDGDTVVEESFEIARYLDRQYPDAPSLFNGAGEEALTTHILNWSQSSLHPEVVKLCLLDIHNALAPEDQAFFRTSREKLVGCTLEEFTAKFERNGKGLQKALAPLEQTLGSQAYLGGESPLFADYAVFGALQWLRTCCTTDVMPKEGAVAAWFDGLLDRDGGMARATIAAYDR